MRLIDADGFIGKFAMSPLVQEAIRKALNHMPTVDAVEVVRCKDCFHFWDGVCKAHIDVIYVDDNDFCSYGERRKDETGKG